MAHSNACFDDLDIKERTENSSDESPFPALCFWCLKDIDSSTKERNDVMLGKWRDLVQRRSNSVATFLYLQFSQSFVFLLYPTTNA